MFLKVEPIKKEIRGIIYGYDWWGEKVYVPFKKVLNFEEKLKLNDYASFGFQKILGLLYIENLICKEIEKDKVIKIYDNELKTLGKFPEKFIPDVISYI